MQLRDTNFTNSLEFCWEPDEQGWGPEVNYVIRLNDLNRLIEEDVLRAARKYAQATHILTDRTKPRAPGLSLAVECATVK